MVDILSGCSFLDVDFIDAVDGRVMSQTEIEECFDTEKSYKRYGRRLGKGEIGCALSHRKCYQTRTSGLLVGYLGWSNGPEYGYGAGG